MKVVNPANESVICELREDSREDVERKFARAKEAQKVWGETSFEKRAAAVKSFGDLLKKRLDSCADLLTAEMGKPIRQSRREIAGVSGRIEYFLNKTEGILEPEKVFSDGKVQEVIEYAPLGVIANISAWNYPYFVGVNAFLPALLTGNAVLYKPSEYSSLSGIRMGELLLEAGIPDGVFQVIVGGKESGEALSRQDLDGLFFTGSYATGVKLSEAVSRKLMRLQLELGGKDPAYICDDASLESAVVSTADGAFYNTGQSCCSVERIYVQETLYDRFLERFVKEVETYVVGDPKDENTYIGPLARQEQLAFLEGQVRDATQKGAHLHLGGTRREKKGYYFNPTVLSNVSHEMDVMKEESFGPIIGIEKVQGDDEAIKKMNDSPYGLTAAVYTKDRKRAETILDQVRAGSLYWNCCDRVTPRLPWSGCGHSGVGVTLSQHGIYAFLRPRAYHWVSP